MNEEKNVRLKINILFTLIIAIITISIVPKAFQNDTFFNISIGKYILENGIDMQEHFSWISGLKYTYSHWAFDIIIYIIYSKFSFLGIYIFTILLSIIINISLYYLLYKLNKNPIISFFVVIVFSFLNMHHYVARSQIVSFLGFIIEIYCIEKIIETDEKKYGLIIFIIGIIIANFHAATWPLIFVLFIPYIVASFFNYFSDKNIYTKLKNKSENKLKNLSNNDPKCKKIKEDIEIYEKIINKSNNASSYKIIKRSNYNTKHLLIVMILTIITGFLTPIHDVPFTYIIKSMFGYSNFENLKSIHYISEMQPIVPASSIALLIFLVFLIEFLIFLPTKLKLEHGFLILGLLIMTLTSKRYITLLIFLGSYVIADLINQAFNIYVTNDTKVFEKFLTSNIIVFFIISSCITYTIYKLINNRNTEFFSNKNYPINATQYILENIDYKKMRIYNDYDFGSYLMLNEIPVFIDSRLDVYCSEFNHTDIFKDFISIKSDTQYYEDIFTKYDFTHILLKNDELILKYLKRDTKYNVIYEDEYFTLFERN